jgi:hypothetical protein
VKRILWSTRPFGLVAVIAVAAFAFAGGAGASGPTFSASLTSTPSGVPVPYSTADTSTYVQFVTTFTRTSTDTSSLTHATVSQPVTQDSNNNAQPADFPGPIVSLTSSPACAPTYRDSNKGVACDFGSLKAGAVVTLTVVVQMPQKPASGDLPPFDALAALTVKEGGNDSQPQSSYTDTFFTSSLTTTLTSDTSAAFNTFTNPTITTGETFFTDPSIGNGNPQSTKVNVPSPNGVGVGVLVQLAEGSFPSCPTTKLTCFGQFSTIVVGGSANKGGLFACNALDPTDTNCLQFTVVVAGSTLTFSVNPNKVAIFHTFDLNGSTVTEQVPRCSTKTTDDAGDCIVSVIQDSKTKNITWIARGPGNGGWGGAG